MKLEKLTETDILARLDAGEDVYLHPAKKDIYGIIIVLILLSLFISYLIYRIQLSLLFLLLTIIPLVISILCLRKDVGLMLLSPSGLYCKGVFANSSFHWDEIKSTYIHTYKGSKLLMCNIKASKKSKAVAGWEFHECDFRVLERVINSKLSP